MSTALQTLTGGLESSRPDEPARLDEALRILGDHAQSFARLGLSEKIALLRATMTRTAEVAEEWVRAGHRAKGLPPGHGEEWLVGPVPTMRNLRLLAETLDRVRRGRGAVSAKQLRTRSDGRVEVEVFPTGAIDAALFAGLRVKQVMQVGLTAQDVRQRAARFYGQSAPEGGVSLILGAGNVSSIPPMDALYKMFAEGKVCILKMNPVNEWAGPLLEAAFAAFIDRGFLRIVYGGRDVGAYLVEHPVVGDIHITGSNATHDAIVWGPPGPERDRRKAANEPQLTKTITSELGNVSPVCVVPGDYDAGQLAFMARNVAAMVTNNASFNCNAAKMLITSAAWSQRDDFLTLVGSVLSETPTRAAYYPGALDRYRHLTEGRGELRRYGASDPGRLPWTIIPSVSHDANEPLFSTEPFCSILSETQLASSEPAEFLAEATRFMNDELWGTLNATVIIHPKHERSGEVGGVLDQAIDELRYGTVGINHWPAVSYAATSPAWGGHPSSTLADVQSGIGWVHNTYLLEGVEKAVLRGPLTLYPKPVWFGHHRKVGEVGRRLVDLERKPSWLKVPGLALTAVQG